jgi:hypothetical protein
MTAEIRIMPPLQAGMKVITIFARNCLWVDGCDDDTNPHDHPERLAAWIAVPEWLDLEDEEALQSWGHEALNVQCGCCLIDCEVFIDDEQAALVNSRRG